MWVFGFLCAFLSCSLLFSGVGLISILYTQ